MKSQFQSKASLIIAAAALLLAGFWAGAARHSNSAIAQEAAAAQATDAKAEAVGTASSTPLGVSIPNGGAALIKGRDGYAYVVNSQGIWVRAAQSGKPLALP